MRHINIPIFIPHLGCPNDCVFCNQRLISGVKEFDPQSVIPLIEDALSTVNDNDIVEIAFFGGSFTGIDYCLMLNLLKIANGYLKQGRIHHIRCSTRPDYINDDVLSILKEYGMDTVELGIQSISDNVLKECKRGHTSKDTITACKKIKDFGFRLGGQMMIGLPSSTVEDEIATAEFIASVGCDEARIYPTVVFSGTELSDMCKFGIYEPLSVNEAVSRSAEAFSVFVRNKIKVLRIGLCDSENLHNDSSYFAGPNHAAIGELVINDYYYNKIKKIILEKNTESKVLKLTVPLGHTSKVIGQKKWNKIRLLSEFSFSKIIISESMKLSEYQIQAEVEERI